MRPSALTVGQGQTMKTYQEGIYFNMPFDEYLKLPCLSSSGLKKLLISPTDFYCNSWMNPLRDRFTADKDAFAEGRAYHKRILEGRDAFYKSYAPDYEDDGDPAMIRNSDDLKAALEACGAPKTFKKKADGIARLRDADPKVRILDLEKEAHRAQHAGKEFISAEKIRYIEYAVPLIEHNPNINTFFIGGHPEVTIIWYDDDYGVWMKIRFDYLKIGSGSDLKTFANIMEKSIEVAVKNAFWYRHYHIQSALYLMGNDIGKQFAKDGKVYGYAGDEKWIKLYAETPCDRFNYVFAQKGVSPVAVGGSLMKGGREDRAGVEKIVHAVNIFHENFNRFGTDMWITIIPNIVFDLDEKPIHTDHI